MDQTTDTQAVHAALAARGMELGDPVSVRHVIEAPSQQVWDAVTQPGHLTQCHPFCRENAVEQWPGVGARDTVTYYSGLHFQRDFVEWIEGVGYALEIGPPPEKTAHVCWRIEPLDIARSALTITVTAYLRSDLSASRKAAYQRRVFDKSIARYLDSVVRGVDHLVTTGQAVQKNQFGSHPMYSD